MTTRRGSKRKGCDYERRLVELLESMGFAALRVAGSGCAKTARPDVLASNGSRVISFEVKTTSKDIIYLSKDSLSQLLEFSGKFHSEAFIAVNLGKGWLFKPAKELIGVNPIKLGADNCSETF